jgi:hypothetical protein
MTRPRHALLATVVSGLLVAGSAGADQFRLSSPAFAHGKPIPRKYTCDGADLSPPLRWSGTPRRTRRFAIIAEDPGATAGSWAEWVLYDLAASTAAVPQGVPALAQLPGGARQGRNDGGGVGYSGPCPPPGRAHTYWFRVYALDAPTNLPAEATKPEVFHAMRRHVLAVAEVMGTYSRRPRHADTVGSRHLHVAACHEIDGALPVPDDHPR